jgi:adenylate cyclase
MSYAHDSISSAAVPVPDIAMRVGRAFERPVDRRHFENSTRIADVAAWLVSQARRINNSLELLDELAWRLVAAGTPVARMTFHLPTLHPLYYGIGCRWTRKSGTSEELLVGHAIRYSAAFIDSPIRRVIETGEEVRRHLDGPEALLDFPILAELKADGLTDYRAVPLELSSGRRVCVTLATDRPGGFTDDEIAALRTLGPYLAPLLEIHVARQITLNLLGAYLGEQIGQRVLAGDILRGHGETIRAVVWLCDLRNFTRLSDHLPGPRVIGILNAYFERVVHEIHARKGEVLKFMGDGLLAIFAVADAAFAPYAASRALEAAEAAIKAVDALDGNPVLDGQAVPKMCVSIHFGDVFFGNIGATDRLDFTTIGPAVNLVARLDQLSKVLQRRILVTDDFAEVCMRPLQSLGSHPLRGLSEPHEIFTVPDAPVAATSGGQTG